MKLRGKISGTVSREIKDGFVVDAAFLTRYDLQQIGEESKTTEYLNGDFVTVTDPLKLISTRLRRMLPSARGLTPDILLSLVTLPAEVEIDVPDLDADGCIPWSHDHVALVIETVDARTKRATKVGYSVPMLLYYLAPPSAFAEIVDRLQADWQRQREEAEKKSLKISASSAG